MKQTTSPQTQGASNNEKKKLIKEGKNKLNPSEELELKLYLENASLRQLSAIQKHIAIIKTEYFNLLDEIEKEEVRE